MSTFITHDYHFHSTLSACCHDERMRPEAILAYAVEQGVEELCLTGWEADPDAWLRPYRLAKRAGCRFYAASDAHVLENLGQISGVIPGVAAALELTERDRYRIPI